MTEPLVQCAPGEPEAGSMLRLRGDIAIWVVIAAELATFALLFLSYAFARVRQRAVFDASQATLDLHSGALNTALLITGSWCVARAVHALRADATRAGVRWLAAAIACGAGFIALKTVELAGKFAAGYDLSTNTFYMFYFLLTAFHYLHVVAALLFLVLVLVRARQRAYSSRDCHVPETAAAFWHMVDLLWLVLFPLVYVMR